MLTNLISVVDDDASVCKTTTLLIEVRGSDAPGFESSELFPKSGQLHETYWLIVDVRMPGMNWVQLQSHLAGDVTFLRKPFGDELVLQAIRAKRRHRYEQETKKAYGCTDHMICFALIRGLQEIRWDELWNVR
jgi:FixJ family two-component response regulator